MVEEREGAGAVLEVADGAVGRDGEGVVVVQEFFGVREEFLEEFLVAGVVVGPVNS